MYFLTFAVKSEGETLGFDSLLSPDYNKIFFLILLLPDRFLWAALRFGGFLQTKIRIYYAIR